MNMGEDKKSVPDEELMLRFKDGEVDCFQELVIRHQRGVINVAFRITGNREEAEEVAQEVFLRIYRAAKGYRPEAKFSTYLYKITLNLSLNQVRRAKVIFNRLFAGEQRFQPKVETGEVADKLSSPLQTMEREEVKKAVRKAIRSLPRRQRVAIILSQYQELSYQEISDVMNCSQKAVERLIHRGKSQLKKELYLFLKKSDPFKGGLGDIECLIG
jgi:RNA polymerase sigma-70 factor (ECF subfamily)